MRTARSLTLSLLASFAVACSSTSSPDNTPHTTGVFSLVSADAQALPAQVFDGTIVTDDAPPFHLRVLATSGSLSIDANGHYEHRVKHDALIDGVLGGRPDHTDRGECTRLGGQLHCVSTYIEFVEFTATLSDNVLTVTQDIVGEGHAATYRYEWSAAI